MLDDEFSDSLMENMKSIANVVRIGTQDKFSQVYYASLNLLQGMLNKLKIVKTISNKDTKAMPEHQMNLSEKSFPVE